MVSYSECFLDQMAAMSTNPWFSELDRTEAEEAM